MKDSIKSNGPGKYNQECTLVRQLTNADAVFLIIYNGSKGTGFSVQAINEEIIRGLPGILEELSKNIREDLKKSTQ